MYVVILPMFLINIREGPSWSWSYGSWSYNYLCSQCLSPLMLWVRIPLRARCTTLCDKICQWLVAGQWCSLSTPVSSTNKTDHHDITKILLKVTLNTITLTLTPYGYERSSIVNNFFSSNWCSTSKN
jgi:hypothetical protein